MDSSRLVQPENYAVSIIYPDLLSVSTTTSQILEWWILWFLQSWDGYWYRWRLDRHERAFKCKLLYLYKIWPSLYIHSFVTCHVTIRSNKQLNKIFRLQELVLLLIPMPLSSMSLGPRSTSVMISSILPMRSTTQQVLSQARLHL